MITETRHELRLADSVDALKDDMRRFKGDVVNLLHGVGQAGRESIASAAKQVRSTAEHGMQGLHSGYEMARDFSFEQAKIADQQVRAHPYWVALIAAGIGCLIGRLLLR
jgi:ElaB/YqjD/DUF883 family membrane-anchored ribosome-binding protein